MKSLKPLWCVTAFAAVFVLSLANAVFGQLDNELDRDSWAVVSGDWGDDENWTDFSGQPSVAPSLDFERWANVTNGGIATVTAAQDTGALLLTRGEVNIVDGGSLKVDSTSFTSGETLISNGTLRLTGDGAFEGVNVTNESGGTIEIGATSSFGLSGNFNHAGELSLGIDGDSSGSLSVAGDVVLGGTVLPMFTANPASGDTFEFINGANSVTLADPAIVLPEAFSLERGLGLQLTKTDSSAAISVQNLPILSVSRTSGAAEIINVTSGEIDLVGYSIFSDNGLLSRNGWQSLASQNTVGWMEAAPVELSLAEMSTQGQSTLEVDSEGLAIGNPYVAAATHPSNEDLRFEVSFADGTVATGLVEYVGAPNDLTLRIDPETGQAEISHQSTFIDPIDITAYSILSESGSLITAGWTPMTTPDGSSGWLLANPDSEHLAEINPEQSMVFDTGDEHALGMIFNPSGARDLVFQFATTDGSPPQLGTVVYGELDGVVVGPVCQAPNELGGDLNGNEIVDFPDFLALSANFGSPVGTYQEGDINCNGLVDFPDFLVLTSNFGKRLGETAAVPEPSAGMLLFIAALCAGLVRRRSSGKSESKTMVARESTRTHLLAAMIFGKQYKTTRSKAARVLCLALMGVVMSGSRSVDAQVITQTPGTNYLAFEAEDFFALVNQEDSRGWISVNRETPIVTSFGTPVLPLDSDASRGGALLDQDGTNDQDFAQYQLQFTEPGDYHLYIRFSAYERGNNPASYGNENSIYASSVFGTGGTLIDTAADPRGPLDESPSLYLGIPLAGSFVGDGRLEGNYEWWNAFTNVSDVGGVAINPEAIYTPEVGTVLDWGFAARESQVSIDKIIFHQLDGLTDAELDLLPSFLEGSTPGDFNGDEVLDRADFIVMAENFNDSFPFSESFSKGDQTQDGIVDISDFVVVRSLFSMQGTPVANAPVPEPSALALSVLGMLIVMSIRRRRRIAPAVV